LIGQLSSDGTFTPERAVSRSRQVQNESVNEKPMVRNEVRNELPSLNLKIGKYGKSTEVGRNALLDDNEGPFKFSFNTPDSNSVFFKEECWKFEQRFPRRKHVGFN